MSMKHPATASVLVGAALLLSACGTAAVTAGAPPATIISVAGSQIPRLQLTSGAIQRLGIATQPVRTAPAAAAGDGAREVIPYSAVVYDTDGSTWTFVNTSAGTYRREPITVNAVSGEVALLSAGPPVGARVVTVGAAELLGTEYNISGEE
jgi:hypothetical protein